MKFFGWINIIIGALTLMGELDKRHPDVGMSLFMIVLGVIILIIIYRKENKGNMVFEEVKPTPPNSNTTGKSKQTTYWESYRMQHPNKAQEIENVLDIDMSALTDQDCQEKIQMVERFSQSLNSSIVELKSTFLQEIGKYPTRILPKMIESTQRQISHEADMFHIKEENTSSCLMTKWLCELL